jgi:hypothetical protein
MAFRQNQDGEWWDDDLGIVIDVHGILWYGYPLDGGGPVGPFKSRLEAQRALERDRNGEAIHPG